MNLTKQQRALVVFTLLYLVGFAIYYLRIENYEFLWYVAVVGFFLALIVFTLPRTHFDALIMWGLSLWGLLHMMGGGIRLGDQVLYATPIIHLFGSGESFVLKFDQFVHFFGFGVATLVIYHLLKPYLNERTNWKVMYPLLIMGGMGVGALNEIVEFMAVLALPETGVGGYFNTSLDLVFNALGAIVATILIHFRRSRPLKT